MEQAAVTDYEKSQALQRYVEQRGFVMNDRGFINRDTRRFEIMLLRSDTRPRGIGRYLDFAPIAWDDFSVEFVLTIAKRVLDGMEEQLATI